MLDVTVLTGDKLSVDLRRKEISAAKMAILEQKFDEVKVTGQLLPSALNSAISNSDEIDNVGQIRTASRLVKRTVSSNARKPQTLDVQSRSRPHARTIFYRNHSVSMTQVLKKTIQFVQIIS